MDEALTLTDAELDVAITATAGLLFQRVEVPDIVREIARLTLMRKLIQEKLNRLLPGARQT